MRKQVFYISIFSGINVLLFISCLSTKKTGLKGEYSVIMKQDYYYPLSYKVYSIYNYEDKAVFYFKNDSVVYYKHFDTKTKEPYYSKLKLKKIDPTKYLIEYDLFHLLSNFDILEISDSKLKKDSVRLIYDIDIPINSASSVILNDSVLIPIKDIFPYETFYFKGNLKSIQITSFIKPSLYSEKYLIKDSTTNTVHLKFKFFYNDRFILPIDTSVSKIQNIIDIDDGNRKIIRVADYFNQKIQDTLIFKNGTLIYNKLKLKKYRKNKLTESDLYIFDKIN